MTIKFNKLTWVIGLSIACALILFTIVKNADIQPSNQAAVKPVITGVVIRGVTLPLPVGAPGTQSGKQCDFSGEDVGQNGRMTGASVNCRTGGNIGNTLPGLPARFNAYCIMNAPVKSARLIKAPVPGNANHCDLSGITPKDATGQFKGAIWK